jgi:hypothetical protein
MLNRGTVEHPWNCNTLIYLYFHTFHGFHGYISYAHREAARRGVLYRIFGKGVLGRGSVENPEARRG